MNKLLFLLLALVMCASLTACGGCGQIRICRFPLFAGWGNFGRGDYLEAVESRADMPKELSRNNFP